MKQAIEDHGVFELQEVASTGHELRGKRCGNRGVSLYIGGMFVAADTSNRRANSSQSRPVIIEQRLSDGTDRHVGGATAMSEAIRATSDESAPAGNIDRTKKLTVGVKSGRKWATQASTSSLDSVSPKL